MDYIDHSKIVLVSLKTIVSPLIGSTIIETLFENVDFSISSLSLY